MKLLETLLAIAFFALLFKRRRGIGRSRAKFKYAFEPVCPKFGFAYIKVTEVPAC